MNLSKFVIDILFTLGLLLLGVGTVFLAAMINEWLGVALLGAWLLFWSWFIQEIIDARRSIKEGE